MKKMLSVLLILALVAFATPVFADKGTQAPVQTSAASGDYQENMKRDLLRGLKNVVGSPLEIPITIQEYHEREGRPVIRHIAGAIDGLFRGLVRFGSGAWDFVAAFIPNHQEGMPVNPETLF